MTDDQIRDLREQLQSADPIVRRRAVAALRKLGDMAIEPVCLALKDDDHLVRLVAAQALATIGDGWAVEPLREATSDKYFCVRHAAVDALAEVTERLKREGAII